MSLCRWTLDGERHRYAIAWPGKHQTDVLTVDGIHKPRHGKREEGEEPASKHQVQAGCGK